MILTREELRRVKEYFSRVEQTWSDRFNKEERVFDEDQTERGYRAYTQRQAQVYRELAASGMQLYSRIVAEGNGE